MSFSDNKLFHCWLVVRGWVSFFPKFRFVYKLCCYFREVASFSTLQTKAFCQTTKEANDLEWPSSEQSGPFLSGLSCFFAQVGPWRGQGQKSFCYVLCDTHPWSSKMNKSVFGRLSWWKVLPIHTRMGSSYQPLLPGSRSRSMPTAASFLPAPNVASFRW